MGNSGLNRRRFLAQPLLARVAQAGAAAGGQPGGGFMAGAAAGNITPPLGSQIAGGMTWAPAREIHDELHVRCLVLDDRRTRLALAMVEVCILPPLETVNRIKARIREQTGIAPSHVMVSAVHTHSAPATHAIFQNDPDPAYVEWMGVRIADTVQAAVSHLEPSRIGWGVGREDRLVFNRRYLMKPGSIPPDPFGGTTDRVQAFPGAANPNALSPVGPVDPEVGIIGVQALDGRPIALFANYALHYVGGVPGGHVSADYAGAWSHAVARLVGAAPSWKHPEFVAMLSNGCMGNIDGIDVLGPAVSYKPYEKIERYAGVLAAECHRVWRGIELRDGADLGAAVEDLELATRLPDDADVAAARRTLGSAAKVNGQYRERSHIYARETMLLAERGPKAIRTPVQAMRIGSLALANFPAEVFVEAGLETKARSPFRPTITTSIANDYRGYVPTVKDFELGGYQTWRARTSCLEREAAPKLVAAMLRQLDALARKNSATGER